MVRVLLTVFESFWFGYGFGFGFLQVMVFQSFWFGFRSRLQFLNLFGLDYSSGYGSHIFNYYFCKVTSKHISVSSKVWQFLNYFLNFDSNFSVFVVMSPISNALRFQHHKFWMYLMKSIVWITVQFLEQRFVDWNHVLLPREKK